MSRPLQNQGGRSETKAPADNLLTGFLFTPPQAGMHFEFSDHVHLMWCHNSNPRIYRAFPKTKSSSSKGRARGGNRYLFNKAFGLMFYCSPSQKSSLGVGGLTWSLIPMKSYTHGKQVERRLCQLELTQLEESHLEVLCNTWCFFRASDGPT